MSQIRFNPESNRRMVVRMAVDTSGAWLAS